MNKIAKLFLVIAAALTMAVSFSSCEALLGAMVGTHMTLTVKNYLGQEGHSIDIQFEEYKESKGTYTATGKKQSLTLKTEDTPLRIKDYVKAMHSYKVTVTGINERPQNIPVVKDEDDEHNYASFSDDGEYLIVAGNADYVILLTSSNEALMTARMNNVQ